MNEIPSVHHLSSTDQKSLLAVSIGLLIFIILLIIATYYTWG
jgi:flagellar biogenesis protein FliO